MLGAVLLAFSAPDALGGENRLLAHGHGLEVIPQSRYAAFGRQLVIAEERARNVDSLRAWHAVSAAGAANADSGVDFLPDSVNQRAVRVRKGSGQRV